MQTESTQVQRRTVVKGAAWAAPLVVASATVPAYAASRCVTSTRFSGGNTYNWGTYNSPTGRTNQTLTLGGQFYINDLPADVTVTKITYEFWTENRVGQDSPGPGAFYVKNVRSDRYNQPSNAMPWTPTAGSGFANTTSTTANLVNHTYQSGSTAQSWNLIMTWDASRDSNISSRYTASSTGSTGCRNFTTGPSSRFVVNYSNVVASGSANSPSTSIKGETIITVQLSNGETLRHVAGSGA
ncbi:hypothetical protein [Rothia aerolata]|uniref:Uncharacterized protein n=1 Tax=Rothia aerolata TaxID=1812262 RepID=A0A917MST0_9MICC|nr:hypothetical protein [Rothia aerolata]GGH61441.1 hypothetical protein GCM10007359_10620 [Rothia aerolata]